MKKNFYSRQMFSVSLMSSIVIRLHSRQIWKETKIQAFPIHFNYNLLRSSCGVDQLSRWWLSCAWTWAWLNFLVAALCVTPRLPITCQRSQLRDSTSHSESCLLLKQQRLTRCERGLKALNFFASSSSFKFTTFTYSLVWLKYLLCGFLFLFFCL